MKRIPTFLCALLLSLIGPTYLFSQTVGVKYLNPKIINPGKFKVLRFGTSANYYAGLMWNKNQSIYGDGNDFSIFTKGNRDLTIRTDTGNFIVFPSSGGNMGIGTTSPNSKLVVNHATNDQLALMNTAGNSWQFRAGNSGSLSVKDDGVERLRIDSAGNLGIGTTNPGPWKLAVKGKIRAEEIKVETGWADYVFKEGYKLPSLEEVEHHISENGHLINIPSEREVAANGIELGEMNKLLLEKIEELTLYIIQLKKGQKQLQQCIAHQSDLSTRLSSIEKQLNNR